MNVRKSIVPILCIHHTLLDFYSDFGFCRKHASHAGAVPVAKLLAYKSRMLRAPHDNPTTTPASTMVLQGLGKRLTAATTVATPKVTHHDTIVLFLVALISPIENSGAKRILIGPNGGVPGTRESDRLTTRGENLV